MISFQKLVSPIRRFFGRLGSDQAEDYEQLPTTGDSAHPWQNNLDRLAERSPDRREAVSASASVEEQFQALMDQARAEKIKLEMEHGLNQPKRKTDATVTDAKAWWGQAVATWEPADAKNVDSFAERKHPRSSKWFNS